MGIMPFKKGYSDQFDSPTRGELQDVFEFVWLAVVDADLGPITRAELAERIVNAHDSGMKPEAIKDAVLYELKHQRRTLI
jgi:hypothetical protein